MSEESTADKKKKVYRTYKYPDGRILELTREEFEEVAETFRILINQKRKLEGKAPLLKPEEILRREFFNRSDNETDD